MWAYRITMCNEMYCHFDWEYFNSALTYTAYIYSKKEPKVYIE